VADEQPTGVTVADRGRAIRIARALSSPIGVLVTVPLLVVAVGVGILLVGRDATRTAAESMARRQLAEQAKSIQADVAFALDQAGALFEPERALADPDQPRDHVLARLHDLLVGRPGVKYVSISFPNGTFRAAYLSPDGKVEAQESVVGGDAGRFTIIDGVVKPLRPDPRDYDPRQRAFYQLAVQAGARAWTPPYTFYRSHETGITCTEPIYDEHRALRAVLTVDFDVGALSSYVARPALDQARSIVFTRDGIVLAYPAGDKLSLPVTDKLLRHEDLHDPAVEALFAKLDEVHSQPALRFLDLDAGDGQYFASVAPIGGKRADVAVPLDWYVATVVPARALFGATARLERSSLFASAGALAIAVGLALVLAWNLVRMRRQVAASREEARTAEARARELGSYRLVARLGTGGMGEVWRAEHRLLARQAAIKLIRPEALHDPQAVAEVRERFRREAQTLASMKSRHTIAIFDYGVTDDGTFYYVMELLDGLDLESLVIRYGAQPAERVIGMLVQACQSLAEAHDAGLLHRDIKPPNLFACRAADELDIVKLLDFGIVQQRNEVPRIDGSGRPSSPIIGTPKLTKLGAMLGTPGFMAPEQILGMECDGRADLYALGCVAWWLLAGGEVFSRDGGEAKVHHRHIYDDPPPLRDVVRGWFPDELEAILRACLAKEMDDRPRDARALAERLRAIAIPADHAWTETRAIDWWRGYEPVTSPSLPSAEVQVVVRGPTADPPQPSKTLVERESMRTIVQVRK
jgi:serine/threonine protein kinase